MASFTYRGVRKMAHTGAWVKRPVEVEQSGCQGAKAWRINTGVENCGGTEGEGTQRGRGPERDALEITKRSQFAGGGNKANWERSAKRSQSGISGAVPAGMYHRLQCSAGQVGISVKWLILFGELVVNETGISPVSVHWVQAYTGLDAGWSVEMNGD